MKELSKTVGSGTFCAHVAHAVELAHHIAVVLHLAFDKEEARA